ncbi:hypothetical protein, variant 2 [Blastomyces gilchristii SLH14081]|uniref:Uncharacterized protein n=1 Tax=Blastomyces gilchristii (strain SLH14081) TaxID=559298 RepID=A0A179UYP2_BLAGS|nr:uncharacterized protein BDBG_17535 [Blastomyces gilchristii SLH14081]XP_031579896.1 hypothetical protein, variant 1 [Blastomyces gilchristii SLH14081]XP_031579897.1 hypothetical protein, variant 2 [Blastomyces gilchristii SLH14081]OAT11520.1 hypothetical protein BDBG_17535 [Blastomyces gilchristii SLH14081]OAT11521.1 hypothetical protein, variant 1 [Blastomyces gilchristii SLH14081]OAT11522.1 hypothetical protein, variant 2 [Blastomyces gilchristii SLH14081]
MLIWASLFYHGMVDSGSYGLFNPHNNKRGVLPAFSMEALAQRWASLGDSEWIGGRQGLEFNTRWIAGFVLEETRPKVKLKGEEVMYMPIPTEKGGNRNKNGGQLSRPSYVLLYLDTPILERKSGIGPRVVAHPSRWEYSKSLYLGAIRSSKFQGILYLYLVLGYCIVPTLP